MIAVLIVSAAAAVIAYLSTEPANPWRPIFLTYASGAIGGGVFTWLTKMTQLGGVIKEELEKVVYGKAHLSVRNDKALLWENATRSLFVSRFPDLADKLSTDVFRSIFPSDRRFYVRSGVRELDLALVDKERSLVEIKTNFSADLITGPGDEAVIRETNWIYIVGSVPPDDLSAMKEAQKTLYTIDVDGESHTLRDDIVGESPGEDPGSMKVRYSAVLRPSQRYRISVDGIDRQRIDQDNVTCFVATSYLDGLELCVRFDAAVLNVQFFPLGNAVFKDEKLKAGNIHKKTKDLLFSDSGFLLTIQLRS